MSTILLQNFYTIPFKVPHPVTKLLGTLVKINMSTNCLLLTNWDWVSKLLVTLTRHKNSPSPFRFQKLFIVALHQQTKHVQHSQSSSIMAVWVGSTTTLVWPLCTLSDLLTFGWVSDDKRRWANVLSTQHPPIDNWHVVYCKGGEEMRWNWG